MADEYPIQIIFGSESDRAVADNSGMFDILQELEVSWQLSYISAHRHKQDLQIFCQRIIEDVKVFIAAAGMMPGLPGDIAGWTLAQIPVIGVVLDSSTIPGKDTIATAIAMPRGTPALYAGIGKYGLANAAIAAVQILAIENTKLKKKLKDYRAKNTVPSKGNVISSDTYGKEKTL